MQKKYLCHLDMCFCLIYDCTIESRMIKKEKYQYYFNDSIKIAWFPK